MFYFFILLFFFFLLYDTVLVLPYIDMNLPRVYMSSQSWTSLPPPSPYHPSGSSQCISPKHPVSCILIVAQKALINSTSIHYRKSYQSEYRENVSQYNKSYLWQTHSQHNAKWWKAESLFAKIWNNRMMPSLTTSIHYSIKSHRHGNHKRKKENMP